jgi:hypothetical protein
VPLWKPTGTKTHTASLLAKPTPLNINLGSDRFTIFNKKRDIPINGEHRRTIDRVDPCTDVRHGGVGSKIAPLQ